MELAYVTPKIDIPSEVLSRILSDSHTDTKLLSDIPPSQLGSDVAVLNVAVLGVLKDLGHTQMSILSYRLLRAYHGTSKPVSVQDITSSSSASVFCTLICIDGEGIVSISRPTTLTQPTARMEEVRMEQGLCVVYSSNVTYAIHRSSATYLHCICAGDGPTPTVTVFHPIMYPCPYNNDLLLGDIRTYLRTYGQATTGVCKYRGRSWKNVLNHLVFCKANPRNDKCLAVQESRRARNRGRFQCNLCSHPAFVLENSLVQHNLRKHHDEIISTPLPLSMPHIFPTTLLATPTNVSDDDDDLDWLLLPTSSEYSILVVPSSDQRTRFQRREPHESPMSTPEVVSGLAAPSLPNKCPSSLLAADSTVSTRELEPYSAIQSYEVVATLLKTISQADIRQPRGRMELNVGEITCDGVTEILSIFGDILPGDVFADLGAGVGNVAIQVALQTRFEASVGVEVRKELTAITTAIIAKYKLDEPRLAKVRIITADITVSDVAADPDMCRVSHLFSHNTLFTPDAILALEDLCWLPKLRHIAITLMPCHRHRENTCKKSFCRLWTHVSTIRVPVTYKVSLVEVYIFARPGCAA